MKKFDMLKKFNIDKIAAVLLVLVMMLEMFPELLKRTVNITASADMTLSQFEISRWNEIMSQTFNNYNVTGVNNPIAPNVMFANPNTYTVKSDSKYFRWHDTSNDVPAWTGAQKAVTPVTESETYNADTTYFASSNTNVTASGFTLTYSSYHVKDADELVWVLVNRANYSGNIRIVLENDIDMGGANGCSFSYNINLNSGGWLDFNGNGHTIYNLRSSMPFFNLITSKYLLAHDLLYQNCLCFFSEYNKAILYGESRTCLHIENVSATDSLVYSSTLGVGILLGRYDSPLGRAFLKNCSTVHSYVYGTDHIGGLTTCQFNTSSSPLVRYDAPFPECPEAWIKYGSSFPEMIENCYSVDCEVFSNGEDSGALLSCGDGFICRNCFTNNTMYGNRLTGAFIGRIVTDSGPNAGLFDDNRSRRLHTSFINCFASGSVEGSDKIGGFTGFSHLGSRAQSGSTIYKNCYSTAMVGMEYSGNQLGGFIGNEDSYKYESQHPYIIMPDGSSSYNYGDVYINCYAAGEVGNMLTSTDVNTTTGGSLGGFLGNSSTSKNGKYYNCYYDKQTTAMRERACGEKNEFGTNDSQIPGVEGIYTLSSSAKGVKGLADTSGIMGDDIWSYENGYYPMLSVFFNNDIFNLPYDNSRSDLVEKYARASVATVLLNHYDTIIEEDGTEREATEDDKLVYDTVRDITSKFELTTSDEEGIVWSMDDEKNESRQLFSNLGEDGFELSYATVKQNIDGSYVTDEDNTKIITKKFQPNVLTIGRYDDPEDNRGYFYKCFDFAPGVQWIKVQTGNAYSLYQESDPVYYGDSIIGTRSLRLLPTAYINAGDILHINVSTENTDQGLITKNTNYITNGNTEERLEGLFNHSVGTAFAISDRYRMGTNSIYLSQQLELYNGLALTDNSKFSFYSPYSPNNTNSDNTVLNCTNSKMIGSGQMVTQKFNIKNASGIKNLSTNGLVRVRIFAANSVPTSDGQGFYLQKGDEIDYSNPDTLAKWQGEKPFEVKDAEIGFYYLDYYWRLDDGRYLFDRKLVRLTTDNYSVTLKTGILDEEFTVDSANKTQIDQYVTDNITTTFDADDKPIKEWANAYPSVDNGFNGDTAASFYNDYNTIENINGNNYFTKSVSIETSSAETVVSWMRKTDYRLTVLIVEAVDSRGIHHEMSRIDTDNYNQPLNFNNAEYSYDYSTYSVIQDSQTKIFRVHENDKITKVFNVGNSSSVIDDSIAKHILFSFVSQQDENAQGGYSTINDDLIITALFRKNDADVGVEKQVFANTKNSIEDVAATKKTSTYTDNSGTVRTQTYYSSLDEVDSKKNVDNTGYTDLNSRKAMLSGDVLTYRLKAYNKGFLPSREVAIKDIIPEGTVLVEGSEKIYRQTSVSTSSFNRFAMLEDLTNESGYSFEYNSNEKLLTAVLPTINLNENYYLEYKVKIQDLKSTELSKSIENSAEYEYIDFNGDTANVSSENLITMDVIENASVVHMNVDHNDTFGEYSIEFFCNPNNVSLNKNNIVNSFGNELPFGFELDVNSVKLYRNGSEITDISEVILMQNDDNVVTEFKIVPKNSETPFVLGADDKYTVKFNGTQSNISDSGFEIKNKSTVIYTIKDNVTGDTESKPASIGIVHRFTNNTETDVKHLYLSITKNIPRQDTAQTFIFKIERFDNKELNGNPDVSYTKINCTEQTSDNYSGTKIIQIDKRGYYKITEINDWSCSDYIFNNSDFTDIEKNTAITEIGYSSINNESIILQLPRQTYSESLAFPTFFGELKNGAYTKLSYTNSSNIYAYKTAQAFAENNIS